MSARVEKNVPAKSIKPEQTVIADFDAERLAAPFLLRCGAILVDYILLVAVPVVSLLIGRSMGVEPAKLLNSEVSNTGWLIMILLAVTNFLILPLFSGQSIGKMLTGLRIVGINGSSPTLVRLLIRHLIGYPLVFLTGGLGLLIAVLNAKGRGIHDFLAGTMVVYGHKRIERK